MQFTSTICGLIFMLFGVTQIANAQSDSLKITYDATKSPDSCQVLGFPKMYMHSGAGVTPQSAWTYNRGTWGADDGVGQMTKIGTDLWSITIHLRDYYDQAPNGPIPANDTIFNIAMSFRNANGTEAGRDKDCQDIFIRYLKTESPEAENSDGSTFDAVTVEWVDESVGIDKDGIIKSVAVYPNPFTDATTVSYHLDAYAEDLSISIFNITGQEVATTIIGSQAAGSHRIQWDGTNRSGEKLESGIYFLMLQDGANQHIKKLMVTR